MAFKEDLRGRKEDRESNTSVKLYRRRGSSISAPAPLTVTGKKLLTHLTDRNVTIL